MTIRLDNLSQLLFFVAISENCEYDYNVYMSPFFSLGLKKEIMYIKAVLCVELSCILD
jgi:hypothetical protein